MTATALSYITVDVFTATRYEGNPLAVIFGAHDLSKQQMQRIATEFNYSEVTFVLPPVDADNTAQVRIFTPTMEIPFAGHPNVGTAFVLGQMPAIFGKPVAETLRFEERGGLVEVTLLRDAGLVTGARIVAPQALAVRQTIDPALIARCASIGSDAVTTAVHQPVFVSVGLPFAVAQLTGPQALSSAKPDTAAFETANALFPQQEDRFSLFLYARTADRPWQIRARMFAPLDNVPEDPATGSASCALSAYLVSLLPEPDVEIDIRIEQGVEMGRRSELLLHVRKTAGIVDHVSVAGRCIIVMRGTIER